MSMEIEQLSLPDADVTLYHTFFPVAEADGLFDRLRAQVNWQEQHVMIFGKPVLVPRLVAWYGDEGTDYTYSGITVHPQAWIDSLLHIKERIDAEAGIEFNSVLCNLYRNGRDSISWHSDSEPALGHNPVIGSISLGAVRTFHLRYNKDKTLRVKLDLPHGSFLLMRGGTQHSWKHQLPKTARPVGPRINLTFRVVSPH